MPANIMLNIKRKSRSKRTDQTTGNVSGVAQILPTSSRVKSCSVMPTTGSITTPSVKKSGSPEKNCKRWLTCNKPKCPLDNKRRIVWLEGEPVCYLIRKKKIYVKGNRIKKSSVAKKLPRKKRAVSIKQGKPVHHRGVQAGRNRSASRHTDATSRPSNKRVKRINKIKK